MTTTRARAVVLLSVAFVVGLGVGSAAMALANAAKASERVTGRDGGRGGGWMRALELSPEVRDSVVALYRCDGIEIDSIHATIRPAIDSIYRSIKPSVDARRAETRSQVRTILNRVQQERYDSIVQSQDDQRKLPRTRDVAGCSRG